MVTVIGPAIVDVLVKPFHNKVFEQGTYAAEDIRLSYGGNALNEAVILGRLGEETELVTKIGADEAGENVRRFAMESGVNCDRFLVDANMVTGINVVLVDESGERYFLTNPNSNLRKLALEDILPFIPQMGKTVCFPCMFTSPLLGVKEMTELFRRIKENGDRTLFLDMTTPKNGERIEEMRELFSYVDYFMPNEKELLMLSNSSTIGEAAEEVLSCGAGCVIVKRGKNPTKIFLPGKGEEIPVYDRAKPIDSTGAGDCFGGGLIYALENKMPLKEAVRFANACASCTVEAVGATNGVLSLREPNQRYAYMKEKEGGM